VGIILFSGSGASPGAVAMGLLYLKQNRDLVFNGAVVERA